MELEREEEGAEGASWREAASELVVDLGTREDGKTDGAERKEKGREQSAVNYDCLNRQTTRTKIKLGKVTGFEGN